MINARAETALERRTFCDSVRYRRCIIPAKHFYEWDSDKNKVTFFREDRPVLFDFQTLELYSLQEHYISHYIRDYYVQIDGRDGDELEVIGIYAPVLENGERVPDIAKALENKYN